MKCKVAKTAGGGTKCGMVWQGYTYDSSTANPPVSDFLAITLIYAI